jgi:hypothetical protein
MSQLIATTISRTTTATLHAAKASFIPHPMLPLKATRLLSLQHKRYTNASQNSILYSNRIQDNVARLYARRIIELAALSAASMASTTQMEGLVSIEKPKEWQTIDLAEQRRQFGQNISSLGKSKISRVWAAGTFYLFVCICLCMYLFVFVCFLTCGGWNSYFGSSFAALS